MEEKKRLMMVWIGALAQQEHQPGSYDDLFDCVCFFHMLQTSAPAYFTDSDPLSTNTGGNWIVRKTNASVLVKLMNRFAIEGLGARDDLDLSSVVDVVALSKGSDDALVLLGDLVITFVVLSLTTEGKASMSKLSPEDQKSISQNARRYIALYSLKPYKRTQQASSATGAPQTAVGTTPTSEHHGQTTFDSTKTSNLANTTVLQNEIASLRRELAEKSTTVSTLEDRLAFVESEQKDLTAKYRSLLAEHETQLTRNTSEKELYQQLAKKDESIRDLRASLDELSDKFATQKQRVSTLEADAEKLKTRVKDVTVQLKTATSERYDKEQSLNLLQDKFDLGCKVRKELEDENETLRSEVAILRAQVKSASTTLDETRDGSMQQQHNLSETETQSELVDALARVRQLESEVAMMKRSGFGGNDVQSSFQGDESRLTETSINLVDITKLAAIEDELAKERSAAAAAIKEREAMGQHLQHALSQLGDHKELLQVLHQENASLRKGAVDSAAGEAAVREADTLRASLAALQTRYDERRDMMKREQAVLVSTMVRYGHRNLLLQQRELLAPAATVVQQPSSSQSSGALGLVVGLFSGGAAPDTAEVAGSFLTKHRKVLERGLLDAACSHGGSPVKRR